MFQVDEESPVDAPYADHIEDLKDGGKDVEWIALENTGLRERRKSRRETLVKQMNRAQVNAQQSVVTRYVKKALVKAFARSRFDGTTATSPFAKAMLYLKLFFLPITEAQPKQYMPAAPEVYDRTTVLNSMTNLRRLVTGLSRLLGGKHMVVASLLKRVENHEGPTSDVEAYLSDVHDHILLLQTSLYHYEYILANCQPAYISYLQVSGSTSRGNISTLVLALSVVTIGILPMQFVTSEWRGESDEKES
jgi:Mg2+ and Co2+ transporter CorA